MLRVRISPETAEGIGLSAVVSQELPLHELLRNILGVTGKSPERIGDVLRRGSVVIGASRFRWQGLEADADSVIAALAAFPDSEPGRAFVADNCVEAIFREGVAAVPLAREAGLKRRFFKRQDFWTSFLNAIRAPEYVEYSYRESADLFRWRPDSQGVRTIHELAGLLAYSAVERKLRAMTFTAVDLLVKR
jgi:hypothetical protein